MKFISHINPQSIKKVRKKLNRAKKTKKKKSCKDFVVVYVVVIMLRFESMLMEGYWDSVITRGGRSSLST